MAGRPVGAPRDGTDDGGFTLVEVLVVIAIIAALMGLVAAMIPRALKAQQMTQTQTLVQNIGATLELLRSDNEQYGKYPLTRSKDLKIGKVNVGKEIGQANDINVGIETVFFLLNCREIHVGQVTGDETLIQNTDEDKFRAARGNATDAEAREYCDAWGQPLVYFHSNDYKDPKGVVEILSLESKEKIEVRPKKMSNRAGGGFLNPNSFQLFSVGPNGKQDDDEDEEADDIVYIGK
jgi:prepilin-type N-terminal cleavage/methylation domain-containing protein